MSAGPRLEVEGAGEVLTTVAVGPPVAGVGDAVVALAFYAAQPEARPRPRPLDRALFGLARVVHAARLVASDRALRRAAIVPTLLTFAGCAALAAVATVRHRAAEELGPGDGITFQAFLVSFVALASMPPTVLQRMWTRVAIEARRALGLAPGEEPFPSEGYARMLWREGWKAVRQAIVVSAGLFPVLVVVRMLPFGRAESAALGAAWAFYWVVIDAFELPVEVVPGPRPDAPEPWFARGPRRAGQRARVLRPVGWAGAWLARLSRPWSAEIHLGERHPWETLGLGLAIGVVLAVPGVGLFFRSIAIVAATGLQGTLDERR